MEVEGFRHFADKVFPSVFFMRSDIKYRQGHIDALVQQSTAFTV